jgi:hypothetical protein
MPIDCISHRSRQEKSPIANHNQGVAGVLDIAHNMRREEHSLAFTMRRFHELVKKLSPRERVETREWFVQEENGWVRRKHDRQGHLCLLAPRETTRRRRGGNTQALDSAACVRDVEGLAQALSEGEMVTDG